MFFINDTAPPEIYPLPLHDSLPIYGTYFLGTQAYDGAGLSAGSQAVTVLLNRCSPVAPADPHAGVTTPFSAVELEWRSEEHTSELQSRQYLVCRLLLENNNNYNVML